MVKGREITMSETQGGSDKPPVARADELLNNLGRRIGLFVGLAGQRIQGTAVNIREQTRRMEQPEAAAGEKPSQPARSREEAEDIWAEAQNIRKEQNIRNGEGHS